MEKRYDYPSGIYEGGEDMSSLHDIVLPDQTRNLSAGNWLPVANLLVGRHEDDGTTCGDRAVLLGFEDGFGTGEILQQSIYLLLGVFSWYIRAAGRQVMILFGHTPLDRKHIVIQIMNKII